MYAKLFIALCTISAVLAYPSEEGYAIAAQEPLLDFNGDQAIVELGRVRRNAQFDPSKVQLWAAGGGNPGQGVDISAKVGAPVWTSDNGRHIVSANAGYAQHLGGPYGNSRPILSGGAGYTFRF